MRGRVPVLIFAGAAPFTHDGELPGGRNEFIHWIQDVRDQRGILRNYVKYDNEIRTGRNVKQLVHRALQIARSEPAGPVYLVGPREVMEEPVEPYTVDPGGLRAGRAGGAHRRGHGRDRDRAGPGPASADRDVLPGPGSGRGAALVELCELLAIPVLESMAYPRQLPRRPPAARWLPVTTRWRRTRCWRRPT